MVTSSSVRKTDPHLHRLQCNKKPEARFINQKIVPTFQFYGPSQCDIKASRIRNWVMNSKTRFGSFRGDSEGNILLTKLGVGSHAEPWNETRWSYISECFWFDTNRFVSIYFSTLVEIMFMEFNIFDFDTMFGGAYLMFSPPWLTVIRWKENALWEGLYFNENKWH